MNDVRRSAPLALALALFFTGVQFYTSLAALSPTPPVGYVFLGGLGAMLLVVVLVLAALVALVALLRDRAWIDATSRTILGAWIGSALLSSLLGLDPRSGLEVVGVMLLAAVFHVALRRYYARPPVARLLLGLYLATGVAVTLAGLAMMASHRPGALYAFNHGRAAGVFVTANQFATYLLLMGFLAYGVATIARDRALLALAWTATALAAVALVFSLSRAGWIGAVAGAIVLLLARGRRVAAVTAGAVLLAGLVALAALPVARHDPADSLNRVAAAEAGLRAVLLFPLTGTGPMSYWRAYPSLRPPNGAEPGEFGALHPHDVYLSLAGETGLVGLAALLIGALALTRGLRRALRTGGADPRLPLAICAGLVATLAQGLFDTVGIVQMTFVWIPYSALVLAAAESGAAAEEQR